MWSFLVDRIRFTSLLIFSVVILGLISMFSLPRELNPEVKVPYASVTTFFPSASPYDVEDLVTNPLEERILNLDNLTGVSSSSLEGLSSIFVEFETDADIKDRVRALQDAVSTVEGRLPEGAEDPVVSELNFSNEAVLILSLSSSLPYSQFVEIAEEVESEILEVSAVSDVDLVGVRDREVLIEMDPKALVQYGVSVGEVLQSIQLAETNAPLGSVESNEVSYSLRVNSSLDYESLQNLVVRGGTNPLSLADLATVQLQLSEKNQLSRISTAGSEPEESLSLYVYKKTGGDIIEMVDDINTRIESLSSTLLRDVHVAPSLDGAKDIEDQLQELSMSGFQTILLVGFILLLALGSREAFMAGLSIPLTFLISFTGLYLVGISLNFLSLFSLILALGILVDTGVVITEGMYSKLRTGSDPKAIALETIREYQWPLISGTLTTISAFIPMLFMTGIIGEFIKSIPVTVSITLFASLFVGLGFLPVIGSRLLKLRSEEKLSFFERQIQGFKESYQSFLRYLLRRKRRQWSLFVLMLVLFAGSLCFPIFGLLEVVNFPQTDARLMFIEVELEKGTALERTDDVVQEIEKTLLATPEIESYVVTVGGSSNASGSLGSFGVANSNLANFTINLVDERERSSLDLIDDYREIFSKIPNAEIEVMGLSDGPPSASPIEFRVLGPDLEKLKDYSAYLVSKLESTPGAVNVRSSLSNTVSEFVLELDRHELALAGLSPATLSQSAFLSINGVEATTIDVDGDELSVLLQTQRDRELSDILALPISTPSGLRSLSDFAELKFQDSPVSIQHEDGDRSVTITADLQSDAISSEVLADFQSRLEEGPNGYRLEFGGESEEMAESFASLGRAMIIGVLLIVVILVIQFNSYRQVAIILMTIPLALIGVFTGLTLIGLPFSFPAFIGVVALAGIVVNNAIILIDRINKNIESGVDKKEAILEAGMARFQPILLTSVTTVFGILPLALSDPTWGPLGFAIISGLIFSTVLTLLVIPSAYHRFVR